MYRIKKNKGIFSFLMIFAFFLGFSSQLKASANFVPDVKTIYSEGVYMVNLDTDVVIYAKNEHQRFYPYSVTKIMTAIIVLENCPDLNAKVRVGYDATNQFWGDDKNMWNPSTAAFDVGQDNLSYLQCLYGLMVPSGCEAGNILALNLCDSIEDFVTLMNKKAQELGCEDTHFSNTHGLWEEDNYTSAYDMYLITRYAYDHVPKFMDICDTYSYEFPANEHNPDGYTMRNSNQLIAASSEFYLDYVHGVKTGSIDEYYDKNGETHPGGRSLVTTAQKNGFTYIIVSMQAPYYDENGEKYHYNALDHYHLYEWAYDSFVYQTVVSENEICSEVDVEQGENDRLQLVAKDQFSTIVPKDLAEGGTEGSSSDSVTSPVQKKVTLLYDSIVAPVKKGEVLGKLDVVYQGETVQTIDLVAARSVERSQVAYIADRTRSLTDTSWFFPLLALLAVCLITQFVLMAVRRRKLLLEARKRERMKRRNNYK